MDGFVGTESLYITIKGEEDDGLTFEYRQDWDGGGAGLKGPKMSRIKKATTSTPTYLFVTVLLFLLWVPGLPRLLLRKWCMLFRGSFPP